MGTLDSAKDQIRILKQQIEATEGQLRNLKLQLQQAEHQAEASRQLSDAYMGGFPAEWLEETMVVLQGTPVQDIAQKVRQEGGFAGAPSAEDAASKRRWPLECHEYKRYGRQLIMPEVGLHGQLRLKNAKVLVVGVGGLGCPAAAYLAGAGVGRLGLVDGDTVEESNLHRQIAHSTARVGMYKAKSAAEYLQGLNPTVIYDSYTQHLTPQTSIQLFDQYDLILDCTDHPTSRYLISDACVLTGKPLVSASALKTEGQLIVLNNPPRPPGDASGGPCYRCIFPRPPPADSILSCGEGGILGPVVGTMGVLQALEAIKLLAAGIEHPKPDWIGAETEPPRTTLLTFSAYSIPQFRSVRMRARKADCAACSCQATITRQSLGSGSLDYVAFCGTAAPVNILPPSSRITARDFSRLPTDGSNVLIDVRDETQYAICALRGSVNLPWSGNADAWIDNALRSGVFLEPDKDHFVVCRYGNDSQLAARAVLERLGLSIKDIQGGFRAWRDERPAEELIQSRLSSDPYELYTNVPSEPQLSIIIMKSDLILRPAGFAEQRCIARDVLGHYGSIVLSAMYGSTKPTDGIPKHDIIKALKQCIRVHPSLSVIVLSAVGEVPQYARVASLDLDQHLRFLEPTGLDEAAIKQLHGLAHRDRLPHMSKTPPWRVYIAPTASGFWLVLSLAHSLGDGRSGYLFHSTFLKAMQSSHDLDQDASPNRDISSTKELAPPLELMRPTPISWSYLLPPLLNQYAPKFVSRMLGIATERPKDVWFGADERPGLPQPGYVVATDLRALMISSNTTQQVLGACRRRRVRLTGLLSQVIARALSIALRARGKDYVNFSQATAIDLRRCIPEAAGTMGNYASAAEDTSVVSPICSGTALDRLSDRDWEAARHVTEHLAQVSSTLTNQPLSLLKYLNDFSSWIIQKASTPAEHSFELSNVGVFNAPDAGETQQEWQVRDVVFSGSADCGGAALSICAASTKGGRLSLIASWWPGMLGVEDEDAFAEVVLEGIKIQLDGID
ncbi:hypothetical protein Tdes44962_MAKER09469 [Teratosphaeria destructans]|uniref:Adenylyltransferase and sulfurtransferase uba4 n=1 Tax=Teratosphaeria destructans TaxID=418781 RepID=A0A9W7ST38_9PEZI|nr:hypothetical protein Tdes44962_MAKER09469 [Teratosphaeria destructans]